MASDMEMEDADKMSEPDSLASTAESEPQEVYEVESILFEDEEDEQYLVKWAGYPLNRATWEVPEDFGGFEEYGFGLEVFKTWRQEKREIERGLRPPFNIRRWQKEQNRLRREKEARQRARKIKRAQRARERLALLNRPDPDLAVNLFGDESSAESPISKIPASVVSEGSGISSLFVSEVETPLLNSQRPEKRRSLVQKDPTLNHPYDRE